MKPTNPRPRGHTLDVRERVLVGLPVPELLAGLVTVVTVDESDNTGKLGDISHGDPAGLETHNPGWCHQEQGLGAGIACVDQYAFS